MIRSLKISNFRSIKESQLKFAPLTFFYGNNSAGKSSVFYALNVLKNVIQNTNQAVDVFFNLFFVNLGGLKQVIYKHEESQALTISIGAKIEGITCNFKLTLKTNQGEFALEVGDPFNLNLSLPVTFPYALNLQDKKQFKINEVNYNVSWTGITAQVTSDPANDESNKTAQKLTLIINKISELIRSTDIVPLKRGFTKPTYGIIGEGQFISEDEVASKLANDQYLDSKISGYLEQLLDRQFRVRNQPGTSIVNLNTFETESKETFDLVNDGFGVNQLVYLLAKTLNKASALVCIEEPEINLHPGIVRRLPGVLVSIAKEQRKQILVSTHSEALIISVLSSIARGDLKKEDVAFYLTTKEHGVTSFKRQNINKKGEVEGGLTAFMEGELEDIKKFLGKSEKEPEPINPDYTDEET